MVSVCVCCAGHLEEVSTLAAQHDGRVLASASPAFGSTPCEIRIWRVSSGKCSKVRNCHYIQLSFLRETAVVIFRSSSKAEKLGIGGDMFSPSLLVRRFINFIDLSCRSLADFDIPPPCCDMHGLFPGRQTLAISW